jgi:hypothetical protein
MSGERGRATGSRLRAFHQRIAGAGLLRRKPKVPARDNETAPPSAHPFPDQCALAVCPWDFALAVCAGRLAWRCRAGASPLAGASSSAG